MTPTAIQNIIFDLGNVIIDIDMARTEQALHRLLGETFDTRLVGMGINDIFEQYETGMLPEQAFLDSLRAATRARVTDDALREAWNAMLLGIPAPRLDLLLQLRPHYKVFLLSNTNSIHLRWVYEYLETTYGITSFESQYFDGAYYSHHIHRRKPYPATYAFVLEDAGLDAAETLFIDDNPENIEGARTAGLHVLLHPPGNEIVEVMTPYLSGKLR